jgi:DNA methyltransferase 1-associated protein 1
MKKNQRLRPIQFPHPITDPDSADRTRSATGPAPPKPSQSALPVQLSAADMQRFGVVSNVQDKMPSGISFASDRITKPRIAKSTLQTEKIATILSHAGVPELIVVPTPPVVEQFETIMTKVNALLDLRKLKEKEEQEIRVREAEAGDGAS